MMRWFVAMLAAAALWGALFVSPADSADEKPGAKTAETRLEFKPADIAFYEKKVKPLLEARCFRCHGPKAMKLKGGLRLDSRAAVLKGGDTGPAAVPGKPEKSLLIEAINYDGLEMPPRTKLPKGEVAILTKWVKLGLPFSRGSGKPVITQPDAFPLQERKRSHWAWQPIKKPALPAVKNAKWAATPIDRFILARLEAKGLTPAPPADRRALIRRAYFDVIGLPPSPKEVAEFVNDPAPTRKAFATVVDRLLKSPHFGERWGRHWLDLVRYADTLGHEFDFPLRHAHQYRDYVIRALNADVPYDRFITEHIAGDLMPNPRRNPKLGYNESIIGTGFWFLGEDKHAPVDVKAEEAAKIDNQIDVFSKAFLGLTVACARCHDHKFDAISTRDYYALHGFLQSSRRNTALLDPHGTIGRKVAELRKLKRAGEELLRKRATRAAKPAATSDGAGKTKLFEDFNGKTFDGWLSTGWAFGDAPTQAGEWDLHAAKPQFLTAGVANSRRLAEKLGGVLRSPTFTITHDQILYRVKGQGARIRLIIDGYVMDEFSGLLFKGCLQKVNTGGQWKWLRQAGDVHRYKGHRAHIELIDDGNGWLAVDEIRFANNGDPIPKERTASIDGMRSDQAPVSHARQNPHLREKDRNNSREAATAISLGRKPQENGPHSSAQPRRGDSAARRVDDAAPLGLRILSPVHLGLTPQATRFRPSGTGRSGHQTRTHWANVVASNGSGDQLIRHRYVAFRSAKGRAFAERKTTKAPQNLRHSAVVLTSLPVDGQKPDLSIADLLKRIRSIQKTIPDPMRVIAITDGTPEDEHVFIRGSHKNLGPVVHRRMLEAISGSHQPEIKRGSGRLELARRMIAPGNPFPARVMVNRIWHHLTGRGIVGSVDNFGVLGERPTQPKLLDYLAATFIADGWSVKRAIRRVMLSNTYQMSSRPDPAAERADPQNLLLHRMRIRRLEGEAIRDAILAVSGRLDKQQFGPPVPIYLTEFMKGRGRPGRSGPLDGAGRRSIYVVVRRNFLSPMMLAFDTPIPFNTIGRRNVSNVPAQALILMNDPFVIGEARRWAKSVLAREEASPDARIRRMYETAYSRKPTADELKNGLAFLKTQAASLGLKADDWKRNAQVWGDFAHVLFNVKEFIYLR